ncbi:MAG: erythromycin biosynthesis sensory transduction protein eryC1 [Parcubacteria group bacterium CG10_big_fil_rev_8_21_14_0_10_36_14]|nr:MAG: erythromycin biosynthesis sensory transduction protein eryC1 [Parcubacteria group bacterium CG10_big_fil_rev_8_21_14_0_10_36_14]
MKVPFIDLEAQYQPMKGEIKSALEGILDSCAFIQGPAVFNFERDFADYLGAQAVACVNSGTSALYCALRALGIGPEDEVITVPNTFIATAEAVSLTGAKPVFVDVCKESALMDVSQLESTITEKTKAIIPVHLYGQCADMDEILRIAKERGLFVIEDACQAHGAEYKGKKAGTIGDVGAFSFYPGKNLGAYGEGGAVASNNADLISKVKLIRDHGALEKYKHSVIGGNFRMSGFQGAVLGLKLKYLDNWIESRRKNARLYRENLSGLPVEIIKEEEYNKHNYHLFVILTEKRDELVDYLKKHDVFSGIHYPIPVHLQEAYADFGWKNGDYPVSEGLAKKILSLPMYPELREEQIKYVAGLLKELYQK